MVVLCAWCRKVRIYDIWIDAEDGGEWISAGGRRLVTHGICPACADDVTLSECPETSARQDAPPGLTIEEIASILGLGTSRPALR